MRPFLAVVPGVLAAVVIGYVLMWRSRRPMEVKVVDIRQHARDDRAEQVEEPEDEVISLVDGRSDPEPLLGGNTSAAPAELDHGDGS